MSDVLTAWALRLVRATEDTLPDVIRTGLGEVCTRLGATRGIYFGFRDRDRVAVVQVDWSETGPSLVGGEYTEEEAGELFTLLRRGEVVVCSADGTEPELEGLRAILAAEDLAADLVVPVVRDGHLRRAVVLDWVDAPELSAEDLREFGVRLREVVVATDARLAAERGRHQRERALFQQQKIHALGVMAGGILHDVNNVFQAVLGLSELLADDLPPGRAREMAEDIGQAVSRGADLSQRILVFSRQDRRERQVFDVAAAVRDVERLLRSAVPEDRAFEVRIADEVGFVHMPAAELEQALINVCNNAVDATAPGGRIRLDVGRRGDDQIVICVTDTGTGMTEEALSRATEVFFTTKPAGAGTGLGLAMVRRAVEDAGGALELDSTPGRGTEVTLVLPRHQGEAPEPVEEPTSVSGEERVLVVEDDPIVLRVAASRLRRHGYDVCTARSGEGALAVLDAMERPVDLVVTDVVMPGLGGVELYSALRDRGQPPPFLFTTGYDAGQLSESFVDAPDRAVLAKPYTARALLLAVRALLDHSSREDSPL